jgi:gliding motility-associated-like protein
MKKSIILSILLILFLLSGTTIGQIPTNGLVAFFPFNGNANDESWNQNNGTVLGPTLTFDRCSNPNSAYLFNGNSQYISLPPENFLLNEYTYSAWIKVSHFPAEGDDGWMIFSPGSSNSSMCQGFSIHTLGRICGTSYNIGEDPHGCWAVSPSIETDKWFHVVYTRSYQILKIYVNGVLMPYLQTDVYTPYPNNQPANYGSSEYTALIGCRSNYKYDDYFQGVIDDLYVYDRPLTNEEVLELYKSTCGVHFIEGLQAICAGQENVNYNYPDVPGYTSYEWNYSGRNVDLHPDMENILIDFSDSATSGTLSLVVTGNSIDTLTSQFDIIVNNLPEAAGNIHGPSEVCASQTDIQFHIDSIPFAESYEWNYSGTGAQISGNTKNISVDFSSDATAGQLTVSGINVCGSGTPSPSLLVNLNHAPANAGPISGVQEVCQNTGDVLFSVDKIPLAENYIWEFSGENATLSGYSDSVRIYFFNYATSGNLTVYGMNNCGKGGTSQKFPIIVQSCSENPGSLNIPNAFSPNGDGTNDLFIIKGLPEQSQLQVFDRSGKICYQSDNYQNDWDGRDSQGEIMNSDTYWYVLIVPGFQNEFKGFVYLKK